jgi:hypothetical protein
MVDDVQKIIDVCDVIIINTKEKEFLPYLMKAQNKIIIDMVRLDENLLNMRDYKGINW